MCAEPAMAIARSMAIWPRMAVAMVRRTNFRNLKTQRRLGLGGGRGSVLVVPRDVVEGEFRDARSLDWVVGVFDFLRIGQARSLSSGLGAGGRGEELISPIRRRVSVNWALVGTPLRRVLEMSVKHMDGGRVDVLLHVHMVSPIWNLGVQHVQCIGEYRVTEKSQTNGKTEAFNDPITR